MDDVDGGDGGGFGGVLTRVVLMRGAGANAEDDGDDEHDGDDDDATIHAAGGACRGCSAARSGERCDGVGRRMGWSCRC